MNQWYTPLVGFEEKARPLDIVLDLENLPHY